MFNGGTTALRSLTSGVMFALVVLAAGGSGLAQEAPRSFFASPDVYKVVAQNDQYLVIEVLEAKAARPVSFASWRSGVSSH